MGWGSGTLCGRRTCARAHARPPASVRARAAGGASNWGARDGARDASEEGPRASMNRGRSRHPRPPSSGRLTRGHRPPRTTPPPGQATPPPQPPTPRPSVRWCGVGRAAHTNGRRSASGRWRLCCGGGASGVVSRILSSRHARGGAAVAVVGVGRGPPREARCAPYPLHARSQRAIGCTRRHAAGGGQCAVRGYLRPPTSGIGDATTSGAPQLQGQVGKKAGRRGGGAAQEPGPTAAGSHPECTGCQSRQPFGDGRLGRGALWAARHHRFGGGAGADPPTRERP